MKTFEVTVLGHTDLNMMDTKRTITGIFKFVRAKNYKLTRQQDERPLAYSIHGQFIARYVTYDVSFEDDSNGNLELANVMDLDDRILRYLIVRKERRN